MTSFTDPSKITSGESSDSEVGDDAELKKQMSVAAKLENALSFIRSTARTNDYFTGYSLNEIIQERLELIGDDEESTTATVGDSNKPTLLAGLNSLLVAIVGEGPEHDGGAIKDALELKSIEDISDEKQEAIAEEA